MSGNKPDFYVVAKPKEGDMKGSRVGAAWHNNQGGISISLNVGVDLRWDDNLFITLWPNEDKADARSNDDTPPPFGA